jgi:hypothetical protein
LEIVQIDHTQADVLIVDRFTRKVIGRPWLSVAIDLATRTVPAFFIGMERARHRGPPGQPHRPAQGALAGSPGAADRLADGRLCRSGCTWTTRLSSAAAPFVWAALSTASNSTTGRSAARTMAATSSA